MRAHERGQIPLIVPARRAREMLAESLELLQRRPLLADGVLPAIEHTALASSSLYRVEADAQTTQAAAHGVHTAVERLRYALESLQTARSQHSECEAAATVLARALALLSPLAQASARKRREVVGHELTDDDRLRLDESARPDRNAQGAPQVAPNAGRQSARARVRLEVEIGASSEACFYAGPSRDVSSGGVFVGTSQHLPVGTRVTLSVVLPSGHSLEAQGAVRWIRGPSEGGPAGMGVGFTRVSKKDLAQIQESCRQRPLLFRELEA